MVGELIKGGGMALMPREGAQRRAHEADEALARGESWGLLHGVPFTLKDTHCTAGMTTTVGAPHLANYVPPQDSPVAQRLKRATVRCFTADERRTLLGDTNPVEDGLRAA